MKAKKLEKQVVIIDTREEAISFHAFLVRMLGDVEKFHAAKHAKPPYWEFIFWATPKEMSLIHERFPWTESSNVYIGKSFDWDEEYEQLLRC